MPTIQAAPPQTYPVGETDVPSAGGSVFHPARTVTMGWGSLDAAGFTDPNTAIDFSVELQRADDQSWFVAAAVYAVGSPGGWVARNGVVHTSLDFVGRWPAPFSAQGGRIRIIVRDAVPGSGLAQPISLGAITLGWN